MKQLSLPTSLVVCGLVFTAAACDESDPPPPEPVDWTTAPRVVVDRFSAEAGTLMVRDGSNLPGPGEPIDMDVPPLLTTSFGPGGEVVQYYNFDVQPLAPAILYLLFREGEDTPVEGQLPIIDDLPGDDSYSDFWRIYHIIVPADFVANTVTSFEGAYDAALTFESTDQVVNCPVVPEGSTAALRLNGGDADAHPVWYRDQVAFVFRFEEAMLEVTPTGEVPRSPVYVTFNVNPDQPGGGPSSGFVTEPGTVQTHNVVATLPGDSDYSPFWAVTVYDNQSFDTVEDLPTAEAATRLGEDVAQVNCPIVTVNGG